MYRLLERAERLAEVEGLSEDEALSRARRELASATPQNGSLSGVLAASTMPAKQPDQEQPLTSRSAATAVEDSHTAGIRQLVEEFGMADLNSITPNKGTEVSSEPKAQPASKAKQKTPFKRGFLDAKPRKSKPVTAAPQHASAGNPKVHPATTSTRDSAVQSRVAERPAQSEHQAVHRSAAAFAEPEHLAGQAQHESTGQSAAANIATGISTVSVRQPQIPSPRQGAAGPDKPQKPMSRFKAKRLGLE